MTLTSLPSDLVDSFYDASMSTGNEAWVAVVDRLTRLVSADVGAFAAVDQTRRTASVNVFTGYSPEALAEYVDHFAAKDLLLDVVHGLPVGVAWRDALFEDPARLQESEAQRDFFVPRGIAHIAAAVVLKDDDRWVGLAIRRGRRETDAFTERESGLLGQALPHLKRSLQIHRQFAEERAAGADFQQAFDHLRIAAIVVGSGGRILRVNRAGEALLTEGSVICSVGGRLAARTLTESSALAALIASALAASATGRAPGAPIRLCGRGGKVYAAISSPMSPLPVGLGASMPCALILLRCLTPAAMNPDYLRALFGLTPREAQLAALLAAGRSIDQAAAGLGISRETARFHLRNIFGKTESERQGELVALLNRVL